MSLLKEGQCRRIYSSKRNRGSLPMQEEHQNLFVCDFLMGLRKVSYVKYKIKDQELFEKACGLIKKYY